MELNLRNTALEDLAEFLFFTMERLDPTGTETWNDLTEIDRDFYRACTRALILRRDLILLALGGEHLASNNPK